MIIFSKKKALLISAILCILFIVVIRYLFLQLNKFYISEPSETELLNRNTIEGKIYHELNTLPLIYKVRRTNIDRINVVTENLKIGNRVSNLSQLWKTANSWVVNNQLVDAENPELKQVLYALKYSPIIKADLDSRGTQLKLLLTLQGNQKVVFKPKWYEKNKIIEGPVYAGKDRYGSEIVGFYLSLLMNKYVAPISVERHISLQHEIMPVATDKLLTTSFRGGNETCFYGSCFYCKREEPICEPDNSTITGAVIFNVEANFRNYRSPWQRTYSNRKALWQQVDSYCRSVKTKLSYQRIYELTDTAMFDFLIQNGDRHHYETLNGTVLFLDNGKGLGNPFMHYIDILAPLYQCCMIRRKTLQSLLELTGGVLSEKLRQMPDIENFVTEDHLKAIEERLLLIFATIEYCKKKLSGNLNAYSLY